MRSERTPTRQPELWGVYIFALYRPVVVGLVGGLMIGISVTDHATDGSESPGLLVQKYGPAGAQIGGVIVGVLALLLSVLSAISRVRRVRAYSADSSADSRR